jgi:hypothetical protein
MRSPSGDSETVKPNDETRRSYTSPTSPSATGSTGPTSSQVPVTAAAAAKPMPAAAVPTSGQDSSVERASSRNGTLTSVRSGATGVAASRPAARARSSARRASASVSER